MMNPAKILIVEDEVIVAQDLLNKLEDMGYRGGGIASSGEQAIGMVTETLPDLVFMDIVLPGDMDGVEAAAQIHASFDIPVIYVTAYADDALLERAKITEPYGYIVKPFKERELRASIEIALHRHRVAQKLKETKRWLTDTLRSIGDGVIAVDTRGCVTFMNPAAEALTGWRQEDALGREVGEVLKLRDEDNRTMAENPAVTALREKAVVPLRNYTILIAGNGAEIPVMTCAAPIRDERGEVKGSVLVFQDIMTLKQAEEARAREKATESLMESLEKTVMALAAVTAVRDPYTDRHQENVSQLAWAIAKEMGFSADRLEGMRVMGLLHDIGKVVVPFELLSKPGRISKFEETVIKEHVAVGYEILKEVNFPWPVAQAILQHHERLDGSGYPAGLSGPDIILEGRILGVADIVETMAFDLPSRPALGLDQALEEIKQNQGTLYDPEVVDVCVKLFTEKGFKFE